MKAFTLIELLVVISIIGILAALLLANFAGIRDRADDAKSKNNLKQLQTALRLYYNDNQTYPGAFITASCDSLGLATYLSNGEIPTGCMYVRPTSDTFTACVPLANAADKDAESVANRCATDPTMTGVATYFCVCSN